MNYLQIEFITFLLAVNANIILGIIVLRFAPKTIYRYAFLFFVLAQVAWITINYYSFRVDEANYLLWVRLTLFFAVFHVSAFTIFMYTFLRTRDKINKKFFLAHLLITGIVASLTLSQFVFKAIELNAKGQYAPVPGPAIPVFGLFVVISVVFALVSLIRKYIHSFGIDRQRLRFLSLGLFFTFMLVLSFSFVNFIFFKNLSTVRLGHLYTLPFIVFTTYAIARYRFMDIRVFITRSIIYAILISVVMGTFAFSTYIGSTYFSSVSRTGQFIGLAIASLLIVVLIDPIKDFLAIVTNRIFFKAAINYPAVTQELTDVINEEVDLAKLVTRFSNNLEKNLRLQLATVLLPFGEDVFMAPEELNIQKKKRTTKQNNENLQKNYSYLAKYLNANRDKILIIEELDQLVANAEHSQERILYDKIRKSLENIEGHVAVPITIKGKLEAILILGRKKSGEAFSNSDIQLLEVIAPQVASGIQKARLYQEAKEFNVKLEREVDIATTDLRTANDKLQELDKAKSEFMSIASHQLRTPLAGIIGYLDMMQNGDFGKLAKEQQPVVHDVFDASQRLSRLVNTFLNVTRIEAGRFTINYAKIPFHDLIESMYKQLKPTAEKKGVTLIYEKKELPEAEVDIDKMKDVVGNFIDNAIKYTPEGSVTVTAEATDKIIHVMVKDTGVGIPKGEDAQLFNKFVRGEGIAQINPNGSGLGLFIAKKVVESHKGKIWAQSDGEGKGSTFHFEIPIIGDAEVKKKAEEFAAKGTKPTEKPDTVSPAPEVKATPAQESAAAPETTPSQEIPAETPTPPTKKPARKPGTRTRKKKPTATASV